MTERERERLRSEAREASEKYEEARRDYLMRYPPWEEPEEGTCRPYEFEPIESIAQEEAWDKVHNLWCRHIDAEEKLHDALQPPRQEAEQGQARRVRQRGIGQEM